MLWLTVPVLFFAIVHASKLVDKAPAETVSYAPFGGKNASILRSPADWNRNTYPLFMHSHNDYERPVPVFEALSYGALSIESDVWLNPKDMQLYVGHDPFSLTAERTFHALTVQPLVKAIEQANTANAKYVNNSRSSLFGDLQASVSTSDSPWWNGYFSLGVGNTQPLQLLVDVKNDANRSWPLIVKALDPLRKRGFLTRYKHGKVIPGPVIVIGTGGTPIDQLAPKHERDVFLDCELMQLNKPMPKIHGVRYDWNNTLCAIASTDFEEATSNYRGIHEPSKQLKQNLTSLIHEAHKRGIKTRFYETPAWPIYARDRVNHDLKSVTRDF
ncbi:hypothetical protein MCAP1_001355 [Malassezia caprae]|uniref:Altered inheritance of mitochondria protein 6 n=1 Tax=Malassezia caprae TaxID=1381934 RepID=A0AAF0IVS9_9BASI|nr:hypothetical protein MCAP1_001355 [Malassezia caprae]